MARLNPIQSKTKSGMETVIRSPEASEAESILNATREMIQTSAHLLIQPEEFRLTTAQEEAYIDRHLQDSGKMMIAAYVAEAPIGVLTFASGHLKRNSHVGTLAMTVLSNYRGQGVGRQMLDALISWAKLAPGIEKIELEVQSKNAPAIALYDKLGFQTEGKSLRAIRFSDGQYDDVIRMGLFVK
ncbi:MAG: GNAT family N-acetyltransferase [Bdellovibrionia bacterium]